MWSGGDGMDKDKIKKEADKAEQSAGRQNTVYTNPCEFYKVKFQVNSTAFLNKQEEKKFYDLLDKKINAFSVVDLTGYASEEGDANDNLMLSEKRVLQIEKLIRSKHPGVTIKKSAKGEHKGSYEENRCVELCISTSPSLQNIYSYQWSSFTSNSYSGPQITEGYWADFSGNKISVRNSQPCIYLETTGIPVGTKLNIKIHEWDGMLWDDYFAEFDVFVGSKGVVFQNVPFEFDLTSAWEDISELYFCVSFDYNGFQLSKYFPEDTDDYLKTSIIEDIPGIMDSKNWDFGASFMRTWMDRPSNSRAEDVDPLMGLTTMDYILGYERSQQKFNEIFTRELWNTENARASFLRAIQNMVDDNLLVNPDIGRQTGFGVTDETIIEENGKRIPRFHRYHFQYLMFEQAYSAPLDDLYAGAGNFTFYLIPFGTITRLNNGNSTVRLNRIGVYIGDKFDFNDTGMTSQFLGYWNAEKKTVLKDFITLPSGYHRVSNSDFRDWRKLHNRGGDYYMYSDIRFIDIEPVEFNISINR